ncbi:MAG: zeta toxin family protein [Pseudobdellovibrionaceae bacterium]
MKQLWILAGGNGAGKSKFYDTYLKDKNLSFINADRLAKEISEEQNDAVAKTAQQQAMDACLQKILNGETFCFETVFSHESKLELIKKAKVNGYEVIIAFIHLNKSELNVSRVYQRVENGGHNVPFDKIISRIPRSVENLKKAIPIVDKVALVDNSSTQDPLRVVARIKKSKVIHIENPLPMWAKDILSSI